MGARSYIPQVGRFLQTDPVPGGSANAYAYTDGNPINEEDPTGELTYSISEGGLAEAEATSQRVANEYTARIEAERLAAEAAAAAQDAEAPTKGGAGDDPMAHAADITCNGAPDYPHISTHAKQKGEGERVNVEITFRCSEPMPTIRARIVLYYNHKAVANSGYVYKYGESWVTARTNTVCRSGLYQSWVNVAAAPPGSEVLVSSKSSAWGTPVGIKC